MIFEVDVLSKYPVPSLALRGSLVEMIHRHCRARGLVFVGLQLWDLSEFRLHGDLRWKHRIEVELVEAGDRAPTSRETVARLMSFNEFQACAREARTL